MRPWEQSANQQHRAGQQEWDPGKTRRQFHAVSQAPSPADQVKKGKQLVNRGRIGAHSGLSALASQHGALM
jgi:hypothetical protein